MIRNRDQGNGILDFMNVSLVMNLLKTLETIVSTSQEQEIRLYSLFYMMMIFL